MAQIEALMAMFSKRPALPAHVSDEAAARALSRHFGDFVAAAKDLGVDRKLLRRLVWSNPAILDAAHERMELAILVQRSEIVRDLMSTNSRLQRRGFERLAANPALRESFAGFDSALDLLTPAPRVRGARGSDAPEQVHLVIEDDGAAERDRELAAERERERERERESELQIAIPVRTPAEPAMSLWPAYIRRPTRGRRWRS